MNDSTSPLECLRSRVRVCEQCELSRTRTNAVPGEGPPTAKLVFVGEAPGRVNDSQGRPFVGHGGAIFDKLLHDVGVNRPDVFVTNAVKCWPPENRRPRARELKACRLHLMAELSLLQPTHVVALGGVAATALSEIRAETGATWTLGKMTHPNALRYLKGGFKALAAQLAEVLGTRCREEQQQLFRDAQD